MITEPQFRELLQSSPEDTFIDFKSRPYNLGNEELDSRFIKDVVSMANTPRSESAYIVMGVGLQPNGVKEFLGIEARLDDADLQSKLNRANVQPRPSFLYYPYTLDGKTYGIIEIKVTTNGPFIPQKDYGVVKKGIIYFRRGSQNADAFTSDEQRNIHEWFDSLADQSPRPNLQHEPHIPRWDEFYEACHRFDPGRRYILVVGPSEQSSIVGAQWKSIARLPLSLVLDFDPATDRNGVYVHAVSALKRVRSVHLWSLGEQSTMALEKACYWYAIRGLEGRNLTLAGDTWIQWNRKYAGPILAELVDNFVLASGGRPITVISMWQAGEYLRSVCEVVDRIAADSADYVFVVNNGESVQTVADIFGAQVIQTSHKSILDGIEQYLAGPGEELSPQIGVPNFQKEFISIDLERLLWLSEDFELVHNQLPEVAADNHDVGTSYLKGADITWADLDNHYDVERDHIHAYEDLVSRELETRSVVRITLSHWPGAGGTTVSRRIAWNLHKQYPTVILRRYVPKETIEKVRFLFQETKQAVLTVIEAADIPPGDLEGLYSEVVGANISCVFVIVVRKFDSRTEGQRSLFLSAILSNQEARRFADTYKKQASDKSTGLEYLVNRAGSSRTPFHFALTAFGRDFMGLPGYVSARLTQATQHQREIVLFISLAYSYGHKPLQVQILAPYLGHSESRILRLQSILAEPQLELLVQSSEGLWRPAHQLIADEVLKQVLTGSGNDRRNWKNSLSTWAIKFIEICEVSAHRPSEELLDMVRRTFILRDENELLGTESAGTIQFAQLIHDIPSDEGKLIVFKKLVEAFPQEAHFWGHLGRFYVIKMNEPVHALEAVDRALALTPKDSRLWHMKGMAYRKIVYNQIDSLRERDAPYDAIAGELDQPLRNALEAFVKAREYADDTEHARVSPIQMLLRVIDFGYKQSSANNRSEFLSYKARSAGWYRELLDEAENLMEGLRQAREGEKTSRYVQKCEADLREQYGDYQQALQGWQNLLSDTNVYAPPIRRQIARAYLARKQRNWLALRPGEVDKIIELMEQNLREEPSLDVNLRLWFQAIRHSTRDYLDIALDRLSAWRIAGDAVDAYYYLYVLHVLKAIEGSSVEQVRAAELMRQTKIKSRPMRNRTRSYDWLGSGTGLKCLVHSSELGLWDDNTNFYSDTSRLQYVEGRVERIVGPESGTLELASCGLSAFFVPARANEGYGLQKGRDENSRVRFFLGFSYDGLRAWSVELMES